MNKNSAIASLLLASVAIGSAGHATLNVTPAIAQIVISEEFHVALEPYGSWQHSTRWGEVWIPAQVSPDWRPYTLGHWVYASDYGWYWASAAEEAGWGLITYDYGRWVEDDNFGWMWVPGTQWGPGWVQWRRGGGYVG